MNLLQQDLTATVARSRRTSSKTSKKSTKSTSKTCTRIRSPIKYATCFLIQTCSAAAERWGLPDTDTPAAVPHHVYWLFIISLQINNITWCRVHADYLVSRWLTSGMFLCVTIVTCSGCCIGWHQRMLGSVWSPAAAAPRPPDITGKEGYCWQPDVKGQNGKNRKVWIKWEWCL